MALFKADEATLAQREAEREHRASAKAQQAADRERQRAEQAAAREQQRAASEQRRSEEEFRRSPAGQARVSYERGDVLFQTSFDIQDVRSVVVPMTNTYTTRRSTDVSDVLNSICAEGWDLHSLSTTFVNEGEESRDKFLSSGQQVAVRGRVMGTYVFVRRTRRH